MCLKKEKSIKDSVVCAIIAGVVISILIIAVLFCRYAIYWPNYYDEVNAEITSSFGSILGATLTPLWSIIATYIYCETLKVQADTLKNSQEIGFSQNLNTLITHSQDTLNKLLIKIRKSIS